MKVFSEQLDWVGIQIQLEKTEHSLVSTVMRWAVDAPDRLRREGYRMNYTNSCLGDISLGKAFERLEGVIKSPLNWVKEVFINKEYSYGKYYPKELGRFMLSSWPGSDLKEYLLSKQDNKTSEIHLDILERIDGYIKEAKSWMNNRELPSEQYRKRDKYTDPEPLRHFLLKGLEQELIAWYELSPNKDYAYQINKLANDWGSTVLTEENYKDVMRVWIDKLSLVSILLQQSESKNKENQIKSSYKKIRI